MNNVKWYPCNKGGIFRKWWGNQEKIINWENDGEEIRNFKDKNGRLRSRPQNLNYQFIENISWSRISAGNIAFRFYPKGMLFTDSAASIFNINENKVALSVLNTKIISKLVKYINPTLNYQPGDISRLPIIFPDCNKRNL